MNLRNNYYHTKINEITYFKQENDFIRKSNRLIYNKARNRDMNICMCV